MNWLDKLERKFGRYAIQNLMLYIVVLYVLGLALEIVAPEFYYSYLSLDVSAILRGQIWRIFTFIIQPPNSGYLFMIIAIYMYYVLGRVLEAMWGTFRFNVYFFSGMFFHVIAAFIIYFVFGMVLPLDTWYLNMSIFLAYATMFPEEKFYLYFAIPIKAKWLGMVDAFYFIYTIIRGFLPSYGGNPVFGYIYKAAAVAAGVSLLNFLIFFFSIKKGKVYPAHKRRKNEVERNIKRAQRPEMIYKNGARHKCAICGRTELDDENLEFRYCSKCNGNYEYCQDHLFTHKHVE